MKNKTMAEFVLELENKTLRKQVEELKAQVEELSDSYDMEIEFAGVIIRLDVEHLEEVMTKLHKLTMTLV